MAGRDNSGALFKNDSKTDEKHPDYRGDVMIDGKEYWVSAWVKTAGPAARNPGSKFLSMSFTSREPLKGSTPTRFETDFDNDIPF